MITIGYSTRKSNPEYQKYLQDTCMHKSVQIIEKINNNEKSLSKVYNEILDESENDIVVFCHDDLEFDTKRWGEKLLKLIDKNKDYGIIGIAGTTDLVDGRWWTIQESMMGIVNHKHEGKKWTNTYSPDQNDKIKDVVIVDGLFFAVNKTKLKHRFDEDFQGFHFYDLAFSFPNYLDGVKIGITTRIRVTHLSIGETNNQWEQNKIFFEEKYKDRLPVRLTKNKTLEEKMEIDLSTIGVGMVTYNAEDRIRQSAVLIPKWIKNFVIVNDGTPYSSDSYPSNAHIIQHEKNKSVGEAKTSALKYLMDQGCEHIFLIEDDILIKDENVFVQYIKHSTYTGIKHLNFALHGPRNKNENGDPIPRIIVPYTDDISMSFFPNCVGAFSYYRRNVIETIGYFDPMYKNAWEHVDHTLKAILKGFHPQFWFFADITDSSKYLGEIPGSFENSTISKKEEWTDNMKRGLELFKLKNKVTPFEIPVEKNENVLNMLRQLIQKR